jgi:uncharacterized protein YnzC (UPF0291/DUF896 family)
MGSMLSSPPPGSEIAPGNPICENIKAIIQPYIKLARQYPIQKIGIPVHFLGKVTKPQDRNIPPGKIPVIRISGFVYLINSSLQSSTNFTLPYFDSIYNMAEAQHTCNGIIVIKYVGIDKSKEEYKVLKGDAKMNENKNLFKPYFYFKRDGRDIYIPVSEQKGIKRSSDRNPIETTQIHTLFTSKFLLQYNDSECKFISIALSLKPTTGGHSNILLVYKGASTTYLILYEPHGAQGTQTSEGPVIQYNQMKSEFIEFLTGVINNIEKSKLEGKNRTVRLIPSIQISPEKGIQTFMKDRNGYCYMISSFWLYIILKLIKDGNVIKDDNFFLNLNCIENCVYRIAADEIRIDTSERGTQTIDEKKIIELKQGSFKGYDASQVLYSIIVHFSYDFLTRFYIGYLRPESDDYKVFQKIYTHNYTNMVKKKFDNIFIELIDKTGGNLTREDLQRIERQSGEEISECPSDGPNDKCKAREYGDSQNQYDFVGDEYSEEKNTHHLPEIDEDDEIQNVTSSAPSAGV